MGKYLLILLYFGLNLDILASDYYIFDDFEVPETGYGWATENFNKNTSPFIEYVKNPVHSGKYAGKVCVSKGESLTLLTQCTKQFIPNGKKPFKKIKGLPSAVGIWVYGKDTGHILKVELCGNNGENVELDMGPVHFNGWKYIRAEVPSISLPVRFAKLKINNFNSDSSELIFDDITVETEYREPFIVTDLKIYKPLDEKIEGDNIKLKLKIQTVSGKFYGEVKYSIEKKYERKLIKEKEGRLACKSSQEKSFEDEFEFKLPAGVYDFIVEIKGIIIGYDGKEIKTEEKITKEIQVFPDRKKLAVKRIDTLKIINEYVKNKKEFVIFENDLVPYLLIYSSSNHILLFNIEGARDLKIASKLPREPWMLVWFSSIKKWKLLKFSNGKEVNLFDFPCLVSFQHKPVYWQITDDGLSIDFSDECGYIWIMPIFGIKRYEIEKLDKWILREEPFDEAMRHCYFWISAMRSVPIAVHEDFILDTENDRIKIIDSFEFLEIKDDWNTPGIHACPVEQLVYLAYQSGMRIDFDKTPEETGCMTSVGPYAVVKGVKSYSYIVTGLLKYITQTRKEIPPPENVIVDIERDYWWVCHSAGQILQLGRAMTPANERYFSNAIDILCHYMLNPDNLHYTYDFKKNHMYIHDGMNWERMGWVDSNAVSAEHIRAFYYALVYGKKKNLIKNHFNHIIGLDNVNTDWSSWGTSCFNSGGGDTFDSTFNAHIFMARIASIFKDKEIFLKACYLSVKKMISLIAVINGAYRYLENFNPPAGIALRGDTNEIKEIGEIFYTDIMKGSNGFMPWNRAVTHRPDEVEYHFANDFLNEYFVKYFSPFRCVFLKEDSNYLGYSPDYWKDCQWTDKYKMKISDKKAIPGIDVCGSRGSNYVFDLSFNDYTPPGIEFNTFKFSDDSFLSYGYILPYKDTIPLNRERFDVSWTLTLHSCNWTEKLENLDELKKVPEKLRGYIIENGRSEINKYVNLYFKQAECPYLICGPFPADTCEAFLEEKIPSLKDINKNKVLFTTVVGGKKYQVKWKEVKSKDYQLDFNSFYSPNKENYVHQAVVYALLYVNVPHDMELNLYTGSDDGIMIWLNEELLRVIHIHRAVVFDDDITPIKLKKGENTLLFKVENRFLGGGWGLVARIGGRNGLPVEDIVFGKIK